MCRLHFFSEKHAVWPPAAILSAILMVHCGHFVLFFCLVAEPDRIHYSSLQVELSQLPSSITDSNIHTVTYTGNSEMCALKNRYTESSLRDREQALFPYSLWERIVLSSKAHFSVLKSVRHRDAPQTLSCWCSCECVMCGFIQGFCRSKKSLNMPLYKLRS